MELKPLERLMLANQCKILEALYPDEENYYKQQREILQQGYEYQYDALFENISDTPLAIADCREVWDILEMYRTLTFSYKTLADKDGVNSNKIKFIGFDYNGIEESRLGDYAKYIILTLDRYEELACGKKEQMNFNSNSPMMYKYRAMLNEWKRSKHQFNLSKEDILRIVNVCIL